MYLNNFSKLSFQNKISQTIPYTYLSNKKLNIMILLLTSDESQRQPLLEIRFTTGAAKRAWGGGDAPGNRSRHCRSDQPHQFNRVLSHFGNYLSALATTKPIAPYLHRDVTRPLGCVMAANELLGVWSDWSCSCFSFSLFLFFPFLPAIAAAIFKAHTIELKFTRLANRLNRNNKMV